MPADGKPAAPDPLVLRLIDRLSDLSGLIAAAMILVAVLVTCQMIWVRAVLNGSTVWQTEVVIYLMIGATLLGLPYVQRLRGHGNVDLLPIWLHGGPRRALAVAVLVASIAVVALMAWHGVEMWWVAWDRGWTSETVWAAPLWIPYLAMPVGFGLYLLQLLADLARVSTGRDRPFGLPEGR